MIPKPSFELTEKDVEKADILVVHGMIVKWSAVKTANIDEVVDEAFLKKIKSWSYSRIPVIGKSSKEISERSSKQSDWESTRIYGFLHIKVRSSPRFCYTLFNCSQVSQNLIGIDIKAKQGLGNGLFVKDLPLYPLSIIRDDMPDYGLLSIFQLGMSR
jgi:metal transporter CNNM